MNKPCPICRVLSVPPTGKKNSPILIYGEKPGDNELKWGVPFCGPSGYVLKEELGRVGIDFKSCRVGNLWIHPANPKSEHHEECFNFCMKIAMKEAENKTAILLLGSDCAETFFRMKVHEICGLRMENDSDLLKAEVIICAPNPASVLQKNGMVGEFRFALRRFAEAIEEIEEREAQYV